MGSKIEIVKIAQPRLYYRQGYISCAVKAALDCIKGNPSKEQIGVMISTAIYRDNHIVEPALASLILGSITQKNILKNKLPHGILDNLITFDMNNGTCGLIQAIQLVDTYIQNGNIKRGMIIAGDSCNNDGNKSNFPFSDGAAAIILTTGSRDHGFCGFHTDSYPQYKDDFIGISQNKNKKTHLTIMEESQFLEHAVTCTLTSLDKFLEKKKMKLSDIDLVLTSHNPVGLISQIRDKTKLGDKVIHLEPKLSNFHTATPLFALEKIIKLDEYKLAKNILFISVGSGITVSLALYKQ